MPGTGDIMVRKIDTAAHLLARRVSGPYRCTEDELNPPGTLVLSFLDSKARSEKRVSCSPAGMFVFALAAAGVRCASDGAKLSFGGDAVSCSHLPLAEAECEQLENKAGIHSQKLLLCQERCQQNSIHVSRPGVYIKCVPYLKVHTESGSHNGVSR